MEIVDSSQSIETLLFSLQNTDEDILFVFVFLKKRKRLSASYTKKKNICQAHWPV